MVTKPRISKKAIMQYLLLYLALWIHGNYFFDAIYDYVLIGIIVAASLFYIKKRNRIDKEVVTFLLVLILLLGMEIVITGGSLNISNALSVIVRYCISLHAYYYDREKFPTRFVKISSFIAAVSLICYIAVSFAPDFMRSIMVCHDDSGFITFTSPLFQFRNNKDIARNSGMFNEPGLYQIVLSGTLYIIVFFKERLYIKSKHLRLITIVLVVALLTTRSATGYISGCILLMAYVLQQPEKGKRKHKRNLLVLGLAAVIGIIVFLQFNSFGNSVAFKVFSRFFDSNNRINLRLSSGISRIVSMQADLSLALEHPLGCGYAVYEAKWIGRLSERIVDSSSCVGLTKSLAVYGFPITIYILCFYIRRKRKNSKNLIETITYILLLFNTILAQPRIDFPVFVFLILMSRIDCRYQKLVTHTHIINKNLYEQTLVRNS